MQDSATLKKYDVDQTYEWNYDHAPEPVDLEVPAIEGDWSFCGLKAASPLGIAAGPLLNGKWLLYYASLGFDILTYKTVRSTAHPCHPFPNLVHVKTGFLSGTEETLEKSDDPTGSWAVSFGMPSKSPEYWQDDVELTRKKLSPEKILSVSVVATVQPEWSLDDLANDYATCAKWALDSGADAVETNFSCPNVSTCDGQLFQNPENAAVVSAKVRSLIGDKPYTVKVGHVVNDEEIEILVDALGEYVDAFVMTNSVPTTVHDESGEKYFEGNKRGICGDATREASLHQTRLFRDVINRRNLKCDVIGVGGISTASHVKEYLDAGADSIQLATSTMLDPMIGLKIRQEF